MGARQHGRSATTTPPPTHLFCGLPASRATSSWSSLSSAKSARSTCRTPSTGGHRSSARALRATSKLSRLCTRPVPTSTYVGLATAASTGPRCTRQPPRGLPRLSTTLSGRARPRSTCSAPGRIGSLRLTLHSNRTSLIAPRFFSAMGPCSIATARSTTFGSSSFGTRLGTATAGQTYSYVPTFACPSSRSGCCRRAELIRRHQLRDRPRRTCLRRVPLALMVRLRWGSQHGRSSSWPHGHGDRRRTRSMAQDTAEQ
mmetsp:Transcript_24910/g.64890  ORF Transcript_24910/g.64890 Transcript_24910/m.64890 type:complete len:257 (+) Transcript_24910:684-1454(+)